MRRWGLISPAFFCYAEIKKRKRRKSLLTTIMIGKALATVTENETLTSGMINAKIKFEFSADWHSGISRTAIFTAGDVTKVVLDSYWENNVCSIPQECLAKSDEILMVGVYGADNANTVAIPTVWATVGKIRKGYEGYEDVSTGTLPIWAQVQSAAAQSAQAAKDAQTAAETAQGKAEDAQAAAETAQAAAETAQGKAETAQSKAETAQGKAESAQTAAESAAASASGSASAAAESAASAAASETASAQSVQTATEKATAAQTAAQAAQSAKAAAESAKAAAVTAGASAESANASAQSAKSAAESAKAAAQTAQSKAETANTSAQTAKADAEAANTSAQSAKTDAESAKSAAAGSAQSAGASAQSAQASSKLSESWAVGGTGTRTGEDTNNAKYWAMAAQGVAGGGVSSFNGRSGAVAPQTGDYTAAMVGADAQGAAETVQDNLNTHAQNTAKHITAAERTAWNGKQNALTFDTAPTAGSTNPITSGGVKAALDDLPQPIIGTAPPTTSTVGVVGQTYIDTAAKLVYHCTAAAATGYTWISADKNLQDTKQDKSTAITTSNIASQTVNKAKYATDGVAVGTPALRNQYFASAESTPTVNGQICWVYG
jgi:chemotaxis protein histidine kinase CheA